MYCTDVCQSRKNPSTVAAVRTVYTHEKNIFYYSVYAMINRLRLGQKVLYVYKSVLKINIKKQILICCGIVSHKKNSKFVCL